MLRFLQPVEAISRLYKASLKLTSPKILNNSASSLRIASRAVPSTPCCWHTRDVNCVKISSDGTLLGSAGMETHISVIKGTNPVLGNDGRVLVSDLSDGSLLHELVHPGANVNALAWLRSESYRRLACGCSNGMVVIWDFSLKGSCKKTIYRQFGDEVDMLDYDTVSNRLLVALSNSVTICDLCLTKLEPMGGNGTYQCESGIGGIGFVASGSRCIVTLPKERKMCELSLSSVAR
jgi:WD40 repeat protein